MLIADFNVVLDSEAVPKSRSIISEINLYRPQMGQPISTDWTPLF